LKIVIIGGQRIAYHLTRSMISKGYRVYVVNKNASFCEELAKRFSAVVIHGDGSKKKVLDQIEFMKNDIVVVLTNRDKDNLIISQMIRRYYGVERVVTLANDPDNIEIFDRLGIHVAVSPTILLAQTIQNLLFVDEMLQFFPMEEGKLAFLRLEIPPTSPSAGKKLKEIVLPEDSVIGGIIRGNDFLIPRGDTSLQPQDRVFVICDPKVQTRVVEALVGA